MNTSSIAADFIGAGAERIFVLAHCPVAFDGRCVLVCPPFAEEMNKTRRMVTDLARRLAATGIAVVVPDLFGTGDSDGDFSDASWDRWLDDLHAVEGWIGNKGWRVDVLLGIRLGCMLATEYSLKRHSAARRAVFWQPMVDGARSLDQFLRMRVAASLMRDQKESIAGLRQGFARGENVEVAGYAVSPRLAAAMDGLKPANLFSAELTRIDWFEVLRAADASVPGAASNAVAHLRQCGSEVSLHTSIGEPFWASSEIVCLPELLAASVIAVNDGAAHG